MQPPRTAAETAWIRTRIDRIHKIPIEHVLHRLGFDVRPDRVGGHQTFSCSLHGRDSRPSARTYPDSESWHCFGCSRSRDAVDTVREKMGLGFEQAIRWLEHAYALAPIPRPERAAQVEEEEEPPRSVPADPVASLELAVDNAARSRTVSLDLALLCWEVVDRAKIDDTFRKSAAEAVRQLTARVTGT